MAPEPNVAWFIFSLLVQSAHLATGVFCNQAFPVICRQSPFGGLTTMSNSSAMAGLLEFVQPMFNHWLCWPCVCLRSARPPIYDEAEVPQMARRPGTFSPSSWGNQGSGRALPRFLGLMETLG